MEFKKLLSVTFHVQRSSCVITRLGDSHYHLVISHDESIFFQSFSFSYWMWLLTKNTRVCVPPSHYDALKYSKIVLCHSLLSYSSSSVNIFSKNFLLFVPVFDHVTVKKLDWILKYWTFKWFLKRLCLTTLFSLMAFTYWQEPQ